MGILTKVQMVRHLYGEGHSQEQYYLTFPTSLVREIGLKRGETLEWIVKDNNNIILKRVQKKNKESSHLEKLPPR